MIRWLWFLILAWVAILIQTTVGRIITFETAAVGTVGPDLLAPLAILVALYARRPGEVMLAACLLGLALDLASAGGPGAGAVVGPMAIAYTLAARATLAVREALFREHALVRAVLTLGFCLIAHLGWVTLQSLVAWNWQEYWRMLAQAVALAAYTALLAPLILLMLDRIRRRLIRLPGRRS